jgi:hypothetical protein
MQNEQVSEPDRNESELCVEGGIDPEFRGFDERRTNPVGIWMASPVAAIGIATRPTAAAPLPRSRSTFRSNTPMPPTTKAAPRTCNRFAIVNNQAECRLTCPSAEYSRRLRPPA